MKWNEGVIVTTTVKWKWDVKTGRMNQRTDDVKVPTDLGENDCWKRRVLSLAWNWDAESARRRLVEPDRLVDDVWRTGSRSSLGSLFQRAGAWWDNDLSVIETRVDCGRLKSSNRRCSSRPWNELERWQWFEQWNGQECCEFNEGHEWRESMI